MKQIPGKRFFSNSLRNRFLIQFGIIIISVFLLMLFFYSRLLYSKLYSSASHQADSSNERFIQLSRYSFLTYNTSHLKSLTELFRQSNNLLWVVLYNKDGTPLTSSFDKLVTDKDFITDDLFNNNFGKLNNGFLEKTILPSDNIRLIVDIKPITMPEDTVVWGYSHIGFSLIPFRNVLFDTLFKAILITLVGITAGIIAIIYISNHLVKPLKQLSEHIQQAADGG